MHDFSANFDDYCVENICRAKARLLISKQQCLQTFDESVLKRNPALKTTKKEKSSHGYGTKIIQDIARKYHGKCDFCEEDGFLCCSVTLRKREYNMQ